MLLRWKNNANKAIGVALVTDDDAKILEYLGYYYCKEEDFNDEDGEYVEVWKPCILTKDKREYFTNARCPRCNTQLLLSAVDDYPLYCEQCNEDFYGIEVREILGDFFEVSIYMSREEFYAMLDRIKEAFPDACFIGYDDMMGVCDIGFEDIPSGNRAKSINSFFNLVEY